MPKAMSNIDTTAVPRRTAIAVPVAVMRRRLNMLDIRCLAIA
jgi:hypothetical protein